MDPTGTEASTLGLSPKPTQSAPHTEYPPAFPPWSPRTCPPGSETPQMRDESVRWGRRESHPTFLPQPTQQCLLPPQWVLALLPGFPTYLGSKGVNSSPDAHTALFWGCSQSIALISLNLCALSWGERVILAPASRVTHDTSAVRGAIPESQAGSQVMELTRNL